jgi:hypothetical protein
VGRFNTAALLLQYVVDSRLDECLQDILTTVSEPPLVPNPYPMVVERLRGAGHQVGPYTAFPFQLDLTVC